MKYRILIVEDDQNFRYAIKEVIPWKENGYEIIGEAIHGKQALEKLEKQQADVVLTDMDMPIMNGVELTKRIKERYPEIVVVALSAYDDFEFVKESMRLGASDYILKQNLDEKAVIEVLNRILKEQKDRKRQQEDGKVKLLKYMRKGMAEEGLEELDREFPRLREAWILVFLIDTEEEVDWSEWENEKEELLWSIQVEPEKWAAIFVVPDGKSESACQEYICSIKRKFKKIIKAPVFIASCRKAEKRKNLPLLYEQAAKNLDYRFYFWEKGDLPYEEMENLERKRKKDYCYQVPQRLEFLDLEGAEALIKDCREKLYLYMPEEEFINKSFLGIYQEFQRRALRWEKDLGAFDYFEELEKRVSIEEKTDFTRSLLREEWKTNIIQYRGSSKEIMRAIEYIHRHYWEELSLKQLADYVGFSENYFSNLFKQEIGENLTMFVNKVRIEQAKALMRQDCKKSYEIGQKVGYQNTTYFSTMFKKITGMSITEYKKTIK